MFVNIHRPPYCSSSSALHYSTIRRFFVCVCDAVAYMFDSLLAGVIRGCGDAPRQREALRFALS
ncbi:Hypothetical protein, putative [Bodo saltans]|uniref:Uncharacterized protein n=1 Tax=Bodo saltans TaxID=75058 RepID=A0A0S4ITC5_BODSA|nr:Hypothetical protein, putative [Bodo saltans]|eukprot:CUF42106.1 Hypothetical protein, putative [Bodo saltans]